MLWTPTFESVAQVLVLSNRAQLVISPGLQANSAQLPAVASPVTEQDLNSEVELLNSPALIQEAIKDIGGSERTGVVQMLSKLIHGVIALPETGYESLHGLRAPGTLALRAKNLASHISVYVIKRSNVIEIGFRSHDADFSRNFLLRLLDRYIDLHVRISQEPDAEKFFQAQAQLLLNRLDRAEGKLRGVEAQTGIAQIQDQTLAVIRELYAAEAAYRSTSALLSGTRQRVVWYERELNHIPYRQAKEIKIVQNMALQGLKPQVLQLEAQRAELRTRYRPDSRKVTEINAQLDAAHSILDRENHQEVQEQSYDINPTWQTLDSDLAVARADAASLAANQSAKAEQMEDLRGQLTSLTQSKLTIDRLQLDFESAKAAYISYISRGEEARAAHALNESKIVNVRVVQAPTLPQTPESPNVKINLLAGLFLALILGLATAYWADMHDSKICATSAIDGITGLSTIVVLDDQTGLACTTATSD
jgi:uncharacterized protein involved in exopolysaccharide biosynthesis